MKRQELYKTIGHLIELRAEVEGYVKAKHWVKAANAGKELLGQIEDADYFGIGDLFPFDDDRRASKEFELARLDYVEMVRAIERGDDAEVERLEAKARKHYQEAFSWVTDY